MTQGVYASLTRQAGLLREMDLIANNIANATTTGFRAESMVFSEYVQPGGAGTPSLSMASGHGHVTHLEQGGLEQTGGTFDMAIEGEGFFQTQGPDGVRLTRAGAFSLNDVGDLVTMDGLNVLDAGGAPVFVPPDAASVHIAPDGTISADGRAIAQIGIVRPVDPNALQRTEGAAFLSPAGVEPMDDPRVAQGFLESSNVTPVSEIARMIAVQHAYESGQSFLQREDERLRSISRLMEG